VRETGENPAKARQKRIAMPTLIRLLVFLLVLVGLGYGAMFALVAMVRPNEKEVTVRIPARDLVPSATRDPLVQREINTTRTPESPAPAAPAPAAPAADAPAAQTPTSQLPPRDNVVTEMPPNPAVATPAGPATATEGGSVVTLQPGVE
jgi:cytoskeletal protein RodZ